MSKIDLAPCLIILLMIVFSKDIRKNTSQKCFSLYETSLIKGFAAIAVVFCHLSLFYSGGLIMPAFYYIGNCAVGLFFFLSGFGLMSQYMLREDYQIGFLKKRLSKILIPYLFFTLLYYLYFLFINEPKSISDVIGGIVKGDPIVSYSWYILEIIVLYVFFYLFMLLSKKDKTKMIVCNVILYVILLIFYKAMGYAPYWYQSTHMYVLGILWAAHEEWINGNLKRFSIPFLAIAVICILFTFGKENLYFIQEIAYLLLLGVLFVSLRFKNRFLDQIGKISMEIYLIHGLIIKFCRYFFSFDEGLIDILVILLVLFLASYLVSFFLKKIIKLVLKQ